MDIEKLQIAFNKFREALKSFYTKYIKPVLEKLKSLFKSYLITTKQKKYKPIKRISSRLSTSFCKQVIVHCRNNC